MAASFFVQPARTLHAVEVCEFGVVDGCACCPEMPLRHMEVNGSGLQVGMPENRLYGGQVGHALYQMCGKTVSKQMRPNGFGDSRSLRGFAATLPTAPSE